MPPATCRLCNGRHAEVNCHQYRTPSERSQRVALLERCAQCLEFKYRCAWPGFCQARCLRCDQPHHEALCTQSAAAPFAMPHSMPSESHVFVDAITTNRPSFGPFFDITTATVPQKGVRDRLDKRKTLLPPPVPQKKPKVDATVGGPQSGQNIAPPDDSACVFCERTNHASVDCRRFPTVDQRETQLVQKGRCYRCLNRGHLVFACCAPLAPCAVCGKFDHHPALCTEAPTKKPLPGMKSASTAVPTAQTNRAGSGSGGPSSSAQPKASGVVDVNASTAADAPNSKAVAPAPSPSAPAARSSSAPRDPRCVFCDNDAHSSADCTHYRTVADRKTRLVLKARCYRCWRKGHTAYFCCAAAITCAKCGRADHHVAVCENALTKTAIPPKSSSAQPTATAKMPAGTAKCSASSSPVAAPRVPASTPSRAKVPISVCEDAVTKTAIPSKSSSAQPTATARKPAVAAKSSVNSSIFAALQAPTPTLSSAKGHADKTSVVASAAAIGSRSPVKSSPSTALNTPAATLSTVNGQTVSPTDMKRTAAMAPAVAVLQVASGVMDATSSAANRLVALNASKTTGVGREEEPSNEDKTNENSRADRSEEISDEVSVAGRPLCPAESGRDASAAAETSESGSAPVAGLPASRPSSPLNSPAVSDGVTTFNEASASVPAETSDLERSSSSLAQCDSGHKPPVSEPEVAEVAQSNKAPDSIVDGSETSFRGAIEVSSIDPNSSHASTEDDRVSRETSVAQEPLEPQNCEVDVEEDHQEIGKMPTTTSDDSDVVSSTESERESDPEASAETVGESTIINHANDAYEKAATSPAQPSAHEVIESPANDSRVCIQSADVPSLASQENDKERSQLAEPSETVQNEVHAGPCEDNGRAGCATTTADSCDKMDVDRAVSVTSQRTDEEAPQLTDLGVAVQDYVALRPSDDNGFAVCAASSPNSCETDVGGEAVTIAPQGNDEQTSQLAEPAVSAQLQTAREPSEDNEAAVCATSTTDPCDKIDCHEAVTQLARLISELEGATPSETTSEIPDIQIDVPTSDANNAPHGPSEVVVKEESHAQSSSEPNASTNAPESDERAAWLSQIERILSPSKAESNVGISRMSASSSVDVILSPVSPPIRTSPALRSAEADDDARVAQEYALQKLAEDLQRFQEAQQAFEAEKEQFEGRKRTFDQECEMLNAMKAAVDAEKEETRRQKQSARDRAMNLRSKEQRLRETEKKISENEDQLKSKERKISALEKKLHDERRSIDAARDILATERADMEKERKSWHDKLRDYDERLKEERKKVEGYWRDVQEKEARCQRQMREVEDEFALLRRKQRDFDAEQRKQPSKYRSQSPHSSSRGSRERSSTDRYQSPSTSRHRSDELRQAEEEIRSVNHQLIAARYDLEDAQKNLQRMREQRDDEAQRREKAEYEAQTLRRQLEDCTQTLTDRTEALNKAISERSAAIKRAADQEKQWREQQQQQAAVVEKQQTEIEVLRWSIEFRKQRSERKLEEAKARKQQQQQNNVGASVKPLPASKTTATKSAKPSVKREVCDEGYEPATPGKAQAFNTCTTRPNLMSVLTSRTSELLLRFPQKTIEKYIDFIVTNFDYFKNVLARELTDFLKQTDPENAELSEAISQIYTSVPSAQ